MSGNNLIVNSAIGIGTAAPSSELHVVGTGQFTGQLVVAGMTTPIAGINILGNKTITFGSDQAKAPNAGSIGYQLTTSGAVDVYGAGTAVGSRNLKLWDNVTVPGTLAVTREAILGGGATVSGNNLIVNNAIGIGTNTPALPLHVVGNGLFTGTMALGGAFLAQAPLHVLGNGIIAADLNVGGTLYTKGVLSLGDSIEGLPFGPTRALTALFNMAPGSSKYFTLGVAPNTYNSGEIRFSYVGSESASNFISIGLCNGPALQVFGSGATVINGPLTVSQGGANLTGSNVLNFGSDQTKATNAGRIGYQLTTSGSLDVYGAGTTVGGRNLKLWDNVMVPGALTVAGSTSTGALTASSVSTPVLTVAGTRVYPQVNADWNATSGLAQILNKPTVTPLCQTFPLTGPWPASASAGTNAVTLKGGYQVWTGSINCYATIMGVVTINWYVNGTSVSSSSMYFNAANCYEVLPTATWVTTLPAGTYTWYW